MSRQELTFIGLGPMGQAMVRAFLGKGHRVTVWNRTASRADALVAEGAVLAPSVRDALAASELVLLSLTDHQAMYDILGQAPEALAGRTIVNLSSDTPDKSRRAAEWAAGHGARYLTGGVNSAPSGIGAPESFTFYSGPEDVFAAHKDTLEVIGGTDYRGADPGLAALFYQLQLDIFWTTTLSWLHAVAVAEANGITAADLLPYASGTLASMPDFLGFYTPRLDAGNFSGEVERLSMGVASVDHVVETARDAGVDTALPAAVLEVFRRGMAAGRAGDSATSLLEILKRPAA
ncbi:NAD(P)-dependent oxidoreductase [Nonomuraea sp. NN258]|uniref:NAD(P)-dependent oxidoreductase n=1 Tax=Nonomuraea antri TaxID=2730852 RepID=UPI00156878C4|nr:NAD(P)-binding domain-containing protein [Nonomuraea antri]NRQ39465.1 NAD(P)-dependent oxidoreductase [Nonomuraea antri]